MGFLDKIKRAVLGPVSIEVGGSETFTWTDAVLPISATLTNSTDKPLAVAELRFTLERPAASDKDSGRLRWTEPGGFTLSPGETVVRSIDLTLQPHNDVDPTKPAPPDSGIPKWAGGALKAHVPDLPRRTGAYKVRIQVRLEVSARLSNASRTVRAT